MKEGKRRRGCRNKRGNAEATAGEPEASEEVEPDGDSFGVSVCARAQDERKKERKKKKERSGKDLLWSSRC